MQKYIVALSAIVATQGLPRISTVPTPGRFVIAGTGEPWTPRGINYIRLNASQGNDSVVFPVYHATFSERFFNLTAVQTAASRACTSLEYNFARVFIDAGDFSRDDGINGPPQGPQVLDDGYVGRLANFISTFAEAGCYTMITLNGLPANAHWAATAGSPPTWCEYPQVLFSWRLRPHRGVTPRHARLG